MFRSVTKWQLITTAIVILAICVRLPLLSGSFWLDEAAQALESVRPWHQQLDIIPDFQPPLLHLIVHAATYFSIQEWWLRLWGALLPGVLSIIVTMAIARQLKASQITTAVTGLLLSLSSFHIFYSQELRPYALPLLWATASWYFLIKLCTDTKYCLSAQAGVRTTAGYAVATTAGLYSSYLYPFLVLSQLCWVVIAKRALLWKTVSALGISALVFAPWLPWFFAQLAAGQLLRVELPGWSEAVSTPQLKALPLTAAKLLFGVVDLELSALWLGMTAAIGLLGAWLAWKQLRSFSSITEALGSRAFLYLCWLVVPLLSSWLISFIVPVLQPKRMLLVQPALFLLLVELGLTQTKKKFSPSCGGGWGEAFFLLILLFTQLFGTYHYWTNPQLQRENWRGLVHEIKTKYPHAAVVMSFPEPFAPWRWYAGDEYPVITTQGINTTSMSTQELSNGLQPATRFDQVLVFDYLSDLTDPERKTLQYFTHLGYQELSTLDSPLIGFVRILEMPQNVPGSFFEHKYSKVVDVSNQFGVSSLKTDTLTLLTLTPQTLYIEAHFHKPGDRSCSLTGTMQRTSQTTFVFQDDQSECAAQLKILEDSIVLSDPSNNCAAYWCGVGMQFDSEYFYSKKDGKTLTAEQKILILDQNTLTPE